MNKKGLIGKLKDRIVTLHTETTIDSAHRLNGYEGKCASIHGHSWHIKVWIRGKLSQVDSVGILFDFGEIKKIKDLLDHKLINDIEIEGEKIFNEYNPTAEHLSAFIHYLLEKQRPEIAFKVRVYETKVGKETFSEIESKHF